MGHPIVKINISRSLGTQEHCCITDNGLVSLEKVFPNLNWFFFTDESRDSWEQLRSFSLPSHVNSLYLLPKARASCFLKGIDIINVLDMYLGWSMDPNILLGSLMFSLPMTLWSTEVLSLDSQWWKNNMGDKNSHGVFCHELQNIFLCFELFFFSIIFTFQSRVWCKTKLLLWATDYRKALQELIFVEEVWWCESLARVPWGIFVCWQRYISLDALCVKALKPWVKQVFFMQILNK